MKMIKKWVSSIIEKKPFDSKKESALECDREHSGMEDKGKVGEISGELIVSHILKAKKEGVKGKCLSYLKEKHLITPELANEALAMQARHAGHTVLHFPFYESRTPTPSVIVDEYLMEYVDAKLYYRKHKFLPFKHQDNVIKVAITSYKKIKKHRRFIKRIFKDSPFLSSSKLEVEFYMVNVNCFENFLNHTFNESAESATG